MPHKTLKCHLSVDDGNFSIESFYLFIDRFTQYYVVTLMLWGVCGDFPTFFFLNESKLKRKNLFSIDSKCTRFRLENATKKQSRKKKMKKFKPQTII